MRASIQVAVPGGRQHDQALPDGGDRFVVVVAEALPEAVDDPVSRIEVELVVIQQRTLVDRHRGTSSACTTMDSSTGAPKVVAIATSEASRPRPMTMRPLR